MIDYSRYYQLLRNSELNARIGGGDPEQVGHICSEIIMDNATIRPNAAILDFGCGVGRVLVSLLRKDNRVVRAVGFDIMPDVVEFCSNNISSGDSRASFYLIEGDNQHYSQHTGTGKHLHWSEIRRDFEASFDLIYAFSVFTHVTKVALFELLNSLAKLLKSDGTLLVSVFLLNDETREAISETRTNFGFPSPRYLEDDRVFVGNSDDPLAFIAFDESIIDEAFAQSNLEICRRELGTWRGTRQGKSLHDIIVARPI